MVDDIRDYLTGFIGGEEIFVMFSAEMLGHHPRSRDVGGTILAHGKCDELLLCLLQHRFDYC